MGAEIMGGLSGISGYGGWIAGYLIPFLFVLTIVVFFHELGHFLVARWCGIKVLSFSLGFGPEIAGFNDRYGTRWKLSAIPLGGYVKFLGDDNAASTPDNEAAAAMSEEDKKVSFHYQPVGSRAAVVVAGPLANFLLAIAIFAVIFMVVGKQTTSARVDAVQPSSAAAAAGFKPGDLVVGIGGSKIEQLHRHAAHRQRQRRRAAHDSRSSATASWPRCNATPQLRQLKDRFGNAHTLGVLGISRSMKPGDIKTTKMGPLTADRRRRQGDLVRGRPHAVLSSAGCSPAAKRPTSLADRFESPRYRARWPPPVSPR